MEAQQMGPLLWTFVIAWAAVTAALMVLLIYRGSLESHEDDQIFLDSAEEHMAAEQRALVARVVRLSKPILVLGITSGVLLVASLALWLWQGFRNF